MAISLPETGTSEQFAARELVRSWAAGSGAVAAARDVEQGKADAWRAVYDGLAQLGIFGVALPEEHGGAGGSADDLCAMVDEAAAAMVPGPIATTALATLVIGDSHPDLLEALASGERTAGLAATAELRYDGGRVSGRAECVLGADPAGVLLLSSGPAHLLPVSAQRVEDLAVTVLAAEAAGLARWTLNTATAYAKVREQFGKPIGSFQAIKHMCAEMLLRSEQISVAASDAASAAASAMSNPDERQLSIAAAVAAATAIDSAKANAKDCIQVLGGIGITFEHDAHLYLRRAYGIAQFLAKSPRR